MALTSRKHLTKKQVLALGGAAAAALTAGGIAHANNVHAANVQPNNAVKTGTPAVQTVQEQQGGQANHQNAQPAAQAANQAPSTQQTNTGNQNASTTDNANSGQAVNNNAGQNANNNVNDNNSTNAGNNISGNNSVNASQQNTNGTAASQPTTQPNAGQNQSSTGSAAPQATKFSANSQQVKAANQQSVKANVGSAANQNNAQRASTPVDGRQLKSGLNQTSQSSVSGSSAAGKSAGSLAGKTAADVNAAKQDNYHPVFVVGPSKQQVQDHNTDIETAKANNIDNLFDEAQNAAKNNVKRSDYQPIIDNGVAAIEKAEDQNGIQAAQKTAMSSLETLEREHMVNDAMHDDLGTTNRPDLKVGTTPEMPTAVDPAAIDPVPTTVTTPNAAKLVLSTDGKTLTIDGNVIPNINIASNGIAQGINAGHKYDKVTKVILNNSQVIGDGQNLFADMPNLESVIGSLNASQADTFEGMFADDPVLTDISGLATWRLPATNLDLYGMFENDPKLSDITPLSDWNASYIDSVGDMFANDKDLTDWTPIQNNWKFNGNPEVTNMFSGSPADNGEDPSYNVIGNQIMLNTADPYNASNYINGEQGSASVGVGDTGLTSGTTNDPVIDFASSGSVSSVNSSASSATNKTSAKSATNSNANSSSTANMVNSSVVYHDQSGKVIGSRNITEPAGSIFNVGPKSQFEKMNMPRGYEYDDPKAPTEYVMAKGMSPIEVGVKPISQNATNGSSKKLAGTKVIDTTPAGLKKIAEENGRAGGAAWQRGAVTSQQLSHPVDIEPAGGFSTNGANASGDNSGSTNAANGSVTTAPGETNAGGATGSAPSISGTTSSASPEASGSQSGSSLPQTSEPVTTAELAGALGLILLGVGVATDRRKHVALG